MTLDYFNPFGAACRFETDADPRTVGLDSILTGKHQNAHDCSFVVCFHLPCEQTQMLLKQPQCVLMNGGSLSVCVSSGTIPSLMLN